MSSRARRLEKERKKKKAQKVRIIFLSLLILFLLITVYNFYDIKMSKVEFTKTKRFRTSKAVGIEKDIGYQKFLKKQLTQSMEIYRGTGMHIDTLMNFYHEYAYFSLPINSVSTRFISLNAETSKKTLRDKAFEIVLMESKYEKYYQNLFFTNQKTIRLIGSFKTMEILGLLGLHEIGHMHDILVGGEDTTNEQEYYEGEVRQHLREMYHLQSINPYVYKKLIRKGKRLINGRIQVRDFNSLVDKLYFQDIELSPAEKSPFYASCITACLFQLTVTKFGEDTERLILDYKKLKKTFERRY
jgi:hypothetical protein